MKPIKSFSIIIFSACLFFACSSNSSTNTNKDSASNNSVSESSGNDMYYELTTTTSGKNMNINGITKMYVSSKGDMRVEMTVHNSANNQSNAPMVLIGHSSKPHESILIDDSAKTYTVNHFDSSDFNIGEKVQSTVTKIGEEKLLGFNCVHASVISKKTMGSFYATTDTLDIWKSKDVPMESSVKDLMNQFESRTGNAMYSQDATQQLQQMGCTGFMVKMEMKSKNVSMTMQLTKAEHRNLDAAMFQVPAGYTEQKD